MDSTQLVQIRKDFYLNIRRKVESILWQESKEIKAYADVYNRELNRSTVQPIDKRHFFARIKSADVVLVGDFHAQKQSSRAFLRIIRKLKSPFAIALECFTSTDQHVLDLFLSGKITERDFLHKVNWKKTWNFPWDNYKAIIKWAQVNKVKVYGINAPTQVKKLKGRDQWSAKQLKKIRSENPGLKILVQYGDLHLAEAHLPKEIKRNISKVDICVVFQSPEPLYFKVMEKQQELTTDVVKINQNKWALNSLPPWIKWQDYLLLLESGYDKRIQFREVEATDTVAGTVDFLSRVFGLKVNSAALSIYSYTDNQFFDQLEKLTFSVRKKIIENVQEGHSFYIPELQVGYLSRYSVNHVIRLAAEYIYYQEGVYKSSLLDPKKDFLKLIWLEAVIYFCSKVKNPKRKTDTLHDIRLALQKEQFDDRGKEALMIALNQKLVEMNSSSIPQNSLMKNSPRSIVGATQILGGILGEKLFYAYSKKLLKLPQDRKLIFKDISSKNFTVIYYELIELVESWPVLFKSKYDRL